jgi:hypothetical protein
MCAGSCSHAGPVEVRQLCGKREQAASAYVVAVRNNGRPTWCFQRGHIRTWLDCLGLVEGTGVTSSVGLNCLHSCSGACCHAAGREMPAS